MIDSMDQPICVVCDKRVAHQASLCCYSCQALFAKWLAEIPALYDRLSAMPGVGNLASRRAPGFGSRSPARDEVVVLTDRRTRQWEPHDPEAACNVLTRWADTYRDTYDLSRPPGITVNSETGVIKENLDWFYGHHDVEAMATDLRNLHFRLIKANNEADATVPIGVCPVVVEGTTLPDGSLLVLTCEGRLHARAWGELATCATNPVHVWRGLDELTTLAAALGDAEMDAPGIARYLGLKSVSTVRTWAWRDKWRDPADSPGGAGERPRRGRRLYYLADARASWLKRQASLGDRLASSAS